MKRLTMILASLAAGAVTAQSDPDTFSAASSKYFMLNTETGSGGHGTSTTYALHASCGSGLVAARSASTTYRLEAGFYGSADTSASGRPWLAGVLPRFTTLRGKDTLVLHGTELNLGSAPTARVDGQASSLVGTPARERVTVKLPNLVRPGWRPVTLTTTAGTTTLPRGIGVLPMIWADPAVASNRASDLVFKGTRGDQIIWAIGIAPNPGPIPIGGFLHGFEINPALFLVLPGFQILGANGEFRLPLPPSIITARIYVQALFTTVNPGYAPGAFSNLHVIHP